MKKGFTFLKPLSDRCGSTRLRTADPLLVRQMLCIQ